MLPRILKVNKNEKMMLKRITTLSTFGPDGNFDPDGLFSQEIFGKVGSPERQQTFALIDLNTELMHPLMYKLIKTLGAKYGEVMESKAYYEWDSKEKDFIPSDIENGETGYQFFMTHAHEIKFKENRSMKRQQKIDFINKFRDDMFTDVFIVRPAGLRDYIIKDGKGEEDEINPVYRRLLGMSWLLENDNSSTFTIGVAAKKVDSLQDSTRMKMQRVLLDIYENVMTLSDGKKKFIQNIWTKKSTIGGTRNVITASKPSVDDISKAPQVGPNSTVIGLYQFGMALHTKAAKYIRDGVVGPVLDNNLDKVNLVNKKSGKFESVTLDNRTKSKYLAIDTMVGKTLGKLSEDSYGHAPVMIGDGHYLANVYDDGKEVRIMYDNDLPADRDKKNIRPITYIELMAYSFRSIMNNQVGTATRYPITGEGSIYPTVYKVKSTTNGDTRDVLNETWTKEMTMTEWPQKGSPVFNAMAPHYSKLGNLGADFDGDKLVANIQYTDESINELFDLLNSRRNIINSQNKYISNLENDISTPVIKVLNRTNK